MNVKKTNHEQDKKGEEEIHERIHDDYLVI